MQNKQTSGNRSRDIYTSIKTAYTSKYGSAKQSGIVITQGYLRSMSAALSATQGGVTFGILVNDISSGATAIDASEQRLNLVDNFLATEIRVSLLKVATGDTASISTISTFPNALVFAKAGEAKALMNVYNGKLSVVINGETIIDSWDVMRHYRVGNAQKLVLTAATGTGNAWEASTYDNASYGFYPVTPQIELRGNGKNKITLALPVGGDLTGTSSSNYVVLEMRGLLIQNGSTIAQK